MRRTGPGRPRLEDDEESVSVSVRFPTSTYESLYQQAQKDRTTVSEVVRQQVTRPPVFRTQK